jgi:SAM-dependent methyltransferase
MSEPEQNGELSPLDPVYRTARSYDQVANEYSETWFEDPVMRPSLDFFLGLLDESSAVIDAGCGSGRDVSVMLSKNIDVVGVDLSSAMVDRARINVPLGIFRQMDQRYLDYPPETFDGIWSCAALHHVPRTDMPNTLRGFARVLKSEGFLCASIKLGEGESFDSIDRFQCLYLADEFRDLVKNAGFEIVRESTSHSEKGTVGRNPKEWFEIVARKVLDRNSLLDEDIHCDCFLCSESRFKLNKAAGIAGCGGILWGDDDVFVAPDIAPLMDGHLLMVTSSHYVCYGACPQSLRQIIRTNQERVRQLFRRTYDKSTIFLEHGPVRPREAGACISHAHFHCLPISVPILQEIDHYLQSRESADLNTLGNLYEAGQSYLYIEDEVGAGWAYPVAVLPSQLLRQVVALLMGKKEWRWQTSYLTSETNESYRRTLVRLLSQTDRLNLEIATSSDGH